MTGFSDALRKGLDAHTKFDQARHEMEQVLQTASAEVTSVLQAEVSLQFQGASRALGGTRAPTVKYTAIVATTPANRSEELAEASFGELGYPVNLRWQDRFEVAQDRPGFEAVIQSLLASRGTGAKLSALIGRE